MAAVDGFQLDIQSERRANYLQAGLIQPPTLLHTHPLTPPPSHPLILSSSYTLPSYSLTISPSCPLLLPPGKELCSGERMLPRDQCAVIALSPSRIAG